MKKLIFVTVMMLAMALASNGKTNSRNIQLLNNLSTALKNAKVTSTFRNGDFKKTSFDFIGKQVSAFYDTERNELIGFSIPVSEADLPAGAFEDIQKKHNQYKVKETLMFILKNGCFGFYISLTRLNKPTIVINVNAKGKTHIYTRI